MRIDYIYNKIYFEELAYMTVRIGQSEIYGEGQQAGDSGRS